jgi:pyruvate dehydrogenase phosphatase
MIEFWAPLPSPEVIGRRSVMLFLNAADSRSLAVGDHEFKLPEVYTRRILSKTNPGFRLSTKLEDFLPRNLTPPYLSNRADVEHVDLQSSDKDGRFLIMCSDGLIDLYMYDDVRDLTTLEDIAKHIVEVVAEGVKFGDNAAYLLLREALGGNDQDRIWRDVGLEEKWMDDTTVLVQTL